MADPYDSQKAGNEAPQPMVERSKFGVSERRRPNDAEESRPPISSSELLSKGPTELAEHRGPRINWRVLIIAAVIVIAVTAFGTQLLALFDLMPDALTAIGITPTP